MNSFALSLPSGSYDIVVGPGLASGLPAMLRSRGLRPPYFLVSQERILSATGIRFERSWKVFNVPQGERAKSLSQTARLVAAMADAGLQRDSTVVAFGGGVVGDAAGFAASIYMRGVALVHVPTTLLAQVDSAIGGKTSVNHADVKNLLGTFHQPRLVVCDTDLPGSLPVREMASGLYEAVKYGIIRDPEVFRWFETGTRALWEDPVQRSLLVRRCAVAKAAVVMADERDGDLRRVLNFGHTVGHALEAACGFGRLKHGEAVGLGMIAETRIALGMKLLSEGVADRIERGIRSVEQVAALPRTGKLDIRRLTATMRHDKKIRDGRLHFVLPVDVGRVVIRSDVREELVKDVLTQMFRR